MRSCRIALFSVVLGLAAFAQAQDCGAGLFDRVVQNDAATAEQAGPQLGDAQGVMPAQFRYVQVEELQAPAPSPSDAPGVVLHCGNRCVDYVYRRWRARHWGCSPTAQVVLQVTDPCSSDCCTPQCVVDIPVCIPCCCEGTPTVCYRCGLLGKGMATYQWCCGYKIKVIFRRCGDITVVSGAL